MIETYLQRLNISMPRDADAAYLDTLVRSQIRALPFENFDVLTGVPINLAPENLSEKFLGKNRGGYCFELNGLLAQALGELGYQFESRLARVTYRRPNPGPKTHLVHLVILGPDTWLVDAGFGGPGLTAPTPLVLDREFQQNGVRFRLIPEGKGEIQLQRFNQGAWINVYLITPEPVLPIDLEVANHFVSTWERSPFRAQLMCTAHDSEGVLTIQGKKVVRLDPELVPSVQVELTSAEDLQEKLASLFRLRVDPVLSSLLWDKIKSS